MSVHPEADGQDGERVVDLDRAAKPGPPPVVGAQWDELHGCWEVWDDAAGSWFVLTDGGRTSRPGATGLPDFGATAVAEPDEATEPQIVDLDRLAEPSEHVDGAQWNEVVGRWERWDESAEAWVEATDSR